MRREPQREGRGVELPAPSKSRERGEKRLEVPALEFERKQGERSEVGRRQKWNGEGGEET